MSAHPPVAVGIVGASGFTGAELLRLIAGHPTFEVRVATGDTQAGTRVAELYPSLAGAYPDLVFAPYAPELLDGLDLVFCGLPHGTSQALMPELRSRVGHVVDLAADFRLADASLYDVWYGEPHTAPALLPDFAYGLPELFRDSIKGSQAIATPGCYPTAAALALAPLAASTMIPSVWISPPAASGASARAAAVG